MVACQKNEELNVGLIKNQLLNLSIPNKDTIQDCMARLKSITLDEFTIVQVFPLDERTYYVDHNSAVKQLLYVELNADGKLVKLLTIAQTFKVEEGVLDTTDYDFSYEVGCPFNRGFQLASGNNIVGITYYFHFYNGFQFAFFVDKIDSYVFLPPIAGGKWQLEVSYDDGLVPQKYSSSMIDNYQESELINLKLQPSKSNVACVVEMPTSWLKGAYLIQLSWINLNTGIQENVSYPVLYDEELHYKMLFPAPFKVEDVFVYKNIDPWFNWYNMGNVERGITIKDGVLYYTIF